MGKVADINSGFLGDADLNSGLYKLTRIESIADGSVDLKRIGYTNKKPDIKFLLKKGDILYSNINSRTHIGKTAIYESDIELYHGINLLRLTVKNSMNTYFLYAQLNTYKSKKWAYSNSNQAVNQASINQNTLSQQLIGICSLVEQERIANFL